MHGRRWCRQGLGRTPPALEVCGATGDAIAHGRLRFARRLLWLPFLLFVVSLVTFTLGFYGPGDPARVRLGPRATAGGGRDAARAHGPGPSLRRPVRRLRVERRARRPGRQLQLPRAVGDRGHRAQGVDLRAAGGRRALRRRQPRHPAGAAGRLQAGDVGRHGPGQLHPLLLRHARLHRRALPHPLLCAGGAPAAHRRLGRPLQPAHRHARAGDGAAGHRRHDAPHPRQRAGGAGPGVRAHGPGQGPDRGHGATSPRAAQRPHTDTDGAGPQPRHAGRRGVHHRDDLRHSGHRAARGRIDLPARLPGHHGPGAHRRHGLPAGEPPGRHPVRGSSTPASECSSAP